MKGAGIAHQTLHVKAGARVKERIFQIQNANAYDSWLTVWMQRFNRVATNPKTWLIEPRNGSWAQKSRVRYWCAW